MIDLAALLAAPDAAMVDATLGRYAALVADAYRDRLAACITLIDNKKTP